MGARSSMLGCLLHEELLTRSETLPISSYQPISMSSQPIITHHTAKPIPSFELESPGGHYDEDHDDATALLEWLDLVSLDSPRIASTDSIDPYLSRYVVPHQGSASPGGLVHVTWKGFISTEWVKQLFVSTW